MCLAAPLITSLSRLPSRLSWRLPSCLLSCESSPLKSRLWSFITCLAAPVIMTPSRFPPRLSSLVTHESSALAPRLLSHLSSRLWSNLVTSLLARWRIWLFLFFVSGFVSCHVSLFFPCPCRVSRNNVSCHLYRHVARRPLAGLLITTLATSLVKTFVTSFIIASFITCLEAPIVATTSHLWQPLASRSSSRLLSHLSSRLWSRHISRLVATLFARSLSHPSHPSSCLWSRLLS